MGMFIELLGYIFIVLVLTTITTVLIMAIARFIFYLAQKMDNKLFKKEETCKN